MTKPVALATTVWGNGPRRALLLHGLTSAGSTWWRVGEALAQMGFTVVAPDMRGHGSSPAGDFLSIESMRDDVVLLGDGWDFLIGHSMGGAVAAAVVAKHPGFAKKVVLEDPAIDSEVTARFLAESPEPMRNPTIAAIAAEHPDWHPHDVELKLEALLACGPDVSDRLMREAVPWDTWPGVVGSEVPVLVIAADPEVESLVSERRVHEVESSGGARVTRIVGAGHSMHRDAFEQYIVLVQDFVGGVVAAD